MSISHSLFIKYGLQKSPSDQQVEQWVSLVETLILSGVSKDVAGEQAAKKIFPDFHTMIYNSEADSIEALLAAARNRGNNQSGK